MRGGRGLEEVKVEKRGGSVYCTAGAGQLQGQVQKCRSAVWISEPVYIVQCAAAG